MMQFHMLEGGSFLEWFSPNYQSAFYFQGSSHHREGNRALHESTDMILLSQTWHILFSCCFSCAPCTTQTAQGTRWRHKRDFQSGVCTVNGTQATLQQHAQKCTCCCLLAQGLRVGVLKASSWHCKGASTALEPFLGGEASEEQLQQIRGQQEKAYGNTWGDVWTDMENRKHPQRRKEAGIR